MDILGDLPEDSVHAVVCDPPYGLAFMGRSWDDFEPKEYQQFCERWARECLRVLRPGGHLLAFSGNRTHHRLFTGVEDAGFEIRDTVTWHYGSGFPKALNVSKAIDDKKGVEREVVGTEEVDVGMQSGSMHAGREQEVVEREKTVATSDAAQKWDGWKTALKPATEYVVVARAPLGEGTVAENVMEWGTGALNIGASRIGIQDKKNYEDNAAGRLERRNGKPDNDVYSKVEDPDYVASTEGRYPANVVFDEHAARELDRQSETTSGGKPQKRERDNSVVNYTGTYRPEYEPYNDTMNGEGGASRFFYTSKASKSERNIGLPDDEQNEHPTVKPVDLMRWLVQLVTAEGQTVLDPFAGSGTTLLAADYLGRRWIGIERDGEHAELARRRVANYDASEVGEWIDDESVTQAEQATLGDMAATGGGDEGRGQG
jgi:site-specific DNA-methyltransferase (adenine-specific)